MAMVTSTLRQRSQQEAHTRRQRSKQIATVRAIFYLQLRLFLTLISIRCICGAPDETYEQSWPVTPFKLRVTLEGKGAASELICCRIYVDGKHASTEFLGEKFPTTYTFQGYQANPNRSAKKDATTEFLFSLPRPRSMEAAYGAKAPMGPPNPDIATLRAELHRATYTGDKINVTAGIGSAKVDAIGKDAAKSARVSAAASSGKEIGAKGAQAYTAATVLLHEVVSDTVIRYATKAEIDKLLGPAEEPKQEGPLAKKRRLLREKVAKEAATATGI
jgi:hypothetical protein